jgi:quinol monooxygenase YgiN
VSEVVLLAHVRPKPGFEEEAERRFAALLAPTHAEPGCLLYALHRVADRPGDLVFIERWASREALDAHGASAHLVAIGQEAPRILREPVELTYLEPLPGGDPALGRL